MWSLLTKLNKLTVLGLKLSAQKKFVQNASILKYISDVQRSVPVLHYSLQAKDNAELAPVESEEPDVLYQRLIVEVRGHEAAVLKSYEWFVCQAAKELDIPIEKTWVPKMDIMRRVALKSVHVFAMHKVTYDFRTYFRVIQLKHLTGSTADTFLEYIQRNLPEGVAMKVTKEAIEVVPAHIKPPKMIS